ncbi:hypothetical protein [Sphingomonas sp. PR090111-T3T-6A]|uniref:hypothetical protein n=1 Tax=Sphingomonas sp. PR090111-T3T-6A TaxID=685778 RepID=UPI00036DBECF|nr:hypothetical protein [Sphingomonas sp. PR090111-T3T-6A]
MSTELKSVRFIFSAEPSLLARVDSWRRKQADLPSRAEAVRRLLDDALKSTEV